MRDEVPPGRSFPTLKGLAIPGALLLTVVLAPLLKFALATTALWIFLAGAVAIGVLADWVRRATEQIAKRAGPAIGGLINVSFGNLAELILAFFVLAQGHADVVRAQITGSIIGTSLLGLGLAVVVGSIAHGEQRFKREGAGLLGSLLVLVVIALLLPAIFDFTGQSLANNTVRAPTDEQLSLGVSVVLLLLYGANLIYTLVTRQDAFAAEDAGDETKAWPIWLSVGILLVATAAIALEAELVSGALEATSGSLGLSKIFLGVIVLALVGTVSDLFAAVWFARDDKMGLVVSICVGSSIQVALVVAPLLVIGSWLLGHPMTLVFANPLELFAIAGTALVVNTIATDGKTSWFEGVLLVGVYLLFALAFFFSRPVA